ncbi:hypothetical protein E6O75_ATG02814 [Venturia nashicola]|uniref:Uncharacterized protein n=1 Tax=Venturia nashicola TaxID=86259 RepID=A0A4Z1PBH9_9PEZI|nr:hypothetical protein E6O75_ATG02814 [Venturia nashicola]
MPEPMQRKLANRDMPAHAAPIPADHLATKAKSPPTSPTAQSYTSGFDGTRSPRSSRGLQTVPEETPISAIDFAVKPQAQYPSTTAFNQFIDDDHASPGGVPLFSEPAFGREETEDDAVLRRMRSPGSFSAENSRGGEMVSPTER